MHYRMSVQGDSRASVQGSLTLVGARGLSQVGAIELSLVSASHSPRRGHAAWRTRASMPSARRRRKLVKRFLRACSANAFSLRRAATDILRSRAADAVSNEQLHARPASEYETKTTSRRASRDRGAVCPRRFSACCGRCDLSFGMSVQESLTLVGARGCVSVRDTPAGRCKLTDAPGRPAKIDSPNVPHV